MSDPSKVIYPSAGGFPFSNAIRAGDFVFLSGVMAFDKDGSLSTGPIEEQTAIVLDSLGAVLETAGCVLADVIRCDCTLQDPRDFSGFNTVYARYFPKNPPVRTTAGAVHVFDGRVEIGCIAYKPLTK